MGSAALLPTRGYAWFCLEVKSDVKFTKKTAQEWNPLSSPPRPQPVLSGSGRLIQVSGRISLCLVQMVGISTKAVQRWMSTAC